MTDEIIGELSSEEIERVDALAGARGLTREAVIVELVRNGLLAEEARAARSEADVKDARDGAPPAPRPSGVPLGRALAWVEQQIEVPPEVEDRIVKRVTRRVVDVDRRVDDVDPGVVTRGSTRPL